MTANFAPGSMIYFVLKGDAGGIRLSIGLEDWHDFIHDLQEA